MSVFEATVLGIVQGLTEFLPISSSGHLVLVQALFQLREPMVAFDVALHWASLLALLMYFWKDIFRMIRDTLIFLFRLPHSRDREALLQEYPMAIASGLVILATFPTLMIGFVFKDSFEAMFGSVPATAISWIVMSGVLFACGRLQAGDRAIASMNHFDAFIIGVAQGISIIPAISRSGATIFAALLLGIEKKEAARFSFLLAIPAILGAGILEMKEGLAFWEASPGPLAAGFITSAIVSYLTIHLLLDILRRAKFHLFGFYTLAAGILTLIYYFLTRTVS